MPSDSSVTSSRESSLCNLLYTVFAKFLDVTVIFIYCPYRYIEIVLIITSILDLLTHLGSNYLKQIVSLPYVLNYVIEIL